METNVWEPAQSPLTSYIILPNVLNKCFHVFYLIFTRTLIGKYYLQHGNWGYKEHDLTPYELTAILSQKKGQCCVKVRLAVPLSVCCVPFTANLGMLQQFLGCLSAHNGWLPLWLCTERTRLACYIRSAQSNFDGYMSCLQKARSSSIIFLCHLCEAEVEY